MAHPWVEITAYHEAGHAVMALYCGWQVREIAIRRHPNCGIRGWVKHAGAPAPGHLHITPNNVRSYWVRAVKDAVTEAKIAMAGPFAEAKLRRKSIRALGGFDDFTRVVEVLMRLQKVRKAVPALADAPLAYYKEGLFEGLAVETAQLLGRRSIWHAVSTLAQVLLRKHCLSGDEVSEILEQAHAPVGQLRLFGKEHLPHPAIAGNRT